MPVLRPILVVVALAGSSLSMASTGEFCPSAIAGVNQLYCNNGGAGSVLKAGGTCRIWADGNDVYFRGCNVMVQNDADAWPGPPAAAPTSSNFGVADYTNVSDTVVSDGLGNLILGYNDDLGGAPARTGSHNLVIGDGHSWTGASGSSRDSETP